MRVFKQFTIEFLFITFLIFCTGFMGYMIKCISLTSIRDVQWSTVEQSDVSYMIPEITK